MTEWIERLLAKLERVRQTDHEFLGYGAWRHWYRFGPKLAPSLIAWLEAKYGIELPEQYRQFLIEVGNGGAGPYNGLQRFGYLDVPQRIPSSLGTGIRRHDTYPSGLKREWEERYMPDGSLTDGFEENFYDSIWMMAGGDTILAQPFPFIEPHNSNELAEELLSGSAGQVEGGANMRWCVPGALYMAMYGCGATQMLVLNGLWKGSIWMQDLASDNGYYVVAKNFEEWYDQWLDSVLVFCARSLNYRRLLSMFATKDPAEAKDLETLLRANGITCETEGTPSRTMIVLVNQDQKEAARPLIEEFVARTKR
ncbi:SMI1/KNR4 family protein [Zavarzinella formosa]|uniref:SMI1/KNR4 family protein n=1 Tax=Zavarzinella formosa TaxID=360055 RepID=UPI0002D9A93F|nr:SMI1/KNR4 family protein [Zavarzinella formosa]